MAWVEGGIGNDVIDMKDGVTENSDIIQGFAGDDTIFGLGGNDFIYGGENDDHLFGGNNNDYLQGGAGYDTLDGGPGDEDAADYSDSWEGVAVVLTSGMGYGSGGTADGDTLIDIEVLRGSWFDDFLVGNDGDNGLVGQAGDDTLKGGGGTDYLTGFGDNDTLKGGGGADDLLGGDGIDTAAYNDSPAGVLVSLLLNYAYNGDAAGDRLFSIENLTGSAHVDSLAGNDAANVLRGMDGDDTLHGNGDIDTLFGDGGNDHLIGGAGGDLMVGGTGDDTYYVDDIFDTVTESAGQGMDRVRVAISWWSLPEGADIESLEAIHPHDIAELVLVGNSSGNTVIGNDGHNMIFGGGGGDEMRGRNGNDTYYVENAGDTVFESGGQGADEVRTSVSWILTGSADVETLRTTDDFGTAGVNLTGNSTGNILRGNNGSNVLNGADGDDELTGLGGWDVFWFDTPLSAAFNVDVITDFNVADDTIILENTIFGAFAAGGLAAERFVVGTAALDASDNIIYNPASGALFYDVDGHGAAPAIQFAELVTRPALTHLDFIVV